MAATAWTTHTEALLTRLWTEEGRSFGEIAKAVTKTGHAVSRSAVSGRMQRRDGSGVTSATGGENGGDLSTEGGAESETGIPVAEQDQTVLAGPTRARSPTPPPAAGEGQATDSATIVEAKINTPAPGTWPMAALREGQCRFACTEFTARPDEHRFCGEPTVIGPGNLYGSWCPAHLARMFDRSSHMARPSFLKRAGEQR